MDKRLSLIKDEIHNNFDQNLLKYHGTTNLDAFKEFFHVLTEKKEIEQVIYDSYSINERKIKKSNIYAQSLDATKNTINYMFDKYYSFFYVRIVKGKLTHFVMIKNLNFVNPLHKFMKLDPKASKSDKEYFARYSKYWRDLGSVIRSVTSKDTKHYVDYGFYEYLYFMHYLQHYCDLKNTCDFIINHKDNLVLKCDLTEASEELVGATDYPLPAKYTKTSFIPVFSFCYNERYADIPLPPKDDVIRIFGITIPENSKYTELIPVDWKKRTNIAVFRGSFTGASVDFAVNPRLIVSELSRNHPELLDAGIVNARGMMRYRKPIDSKYMYKLDTSMLTYVEPLPMQDQLKYKYILYIEGNVAAYRGATLFATGCVVLWVTPKKYKLWFESLLIDGTNRMYIKSDLSDLVSTIQYLQDNDVKAHQIAKNGLKFFEKNLQKNALISYVKSQIERI